MATRSAIHNRKTGQTVYIHWDGYPDGVGATLKASYNTQEAVDALFERAKTSDMSVLGNTIEECKWYDDRCRKENRELESLTFPEPLDLSAAKVIVGSCWCEYLYSWTGRSWVTTKIKTF